MRKIFLLCLLTALLVALSWCGVRGGVMPSRGPSFVVNCPRGYALHRVRSEYNNEPQNWRLWNWDCRQVSEFKDECRWNFNIFANNLLFRCPKGQYMAGISGVLRSREFNYLWSFKCCKTIGICPVECELSCYINDYQEYIDYTAHEDNGVFVGLYSRFNANETDSQWLIEECKAKPCQLIPGVDLY